MKQPISEEEKEKFFAKLEKETQRFEKVVNTNLNINELVLFDLRKTLLHKGISVNYFFNFIAEKISARDEAILQLVEEASKAHKEKFEKDFVLKDLDQDLTEQCSDEYEHIKNNFNKRNSTKKEKQQIAETLYSLIEKSLAASAGSCSDKTTNNKDT